MSESNEYINSFPSWGDCQYLKQEYDNLVIEIEQYKKLSYKALEACKHCPNLNKVCGDTCSIRELREYVLKKECGESE